ncbi:sodium/proline symporter [Rubripirellula reticaptiva]|uniref:Sodium/proline symporter n=1 Tax=Rubripirellula reticaptiva TaxID=2528013 RepID=A0A5C6EK84_9BACT|nr:sodium/proline symporter [Rubripirellula reticaptiva]TWU48046.1 Sodium/proline symporter [Rubripirellula reticaptiva]
MKLIGIAIYLVILLVIGMVASRRMKDLRDYYAGDKRFGFWAASFSSRATGESAWLLIGLTGMGAAVGAQALWVVLGEVVGVAAAWIFLCGRFKRMTDRYDSITIPDYLESRLADKTQRIRLVAALTLVVFVTIYVSAQIDAIGTAFESFLGWNYYVGAVVGFSIVLCYIVSGGFVAVVWSDVFQACLMVLGLVALPVFGLMAVGGMDTAVERIHAQDPRLMSLWGPSGPGWSSFFTILGFLAIGLGFLGSPQIFVRFLSMRSEKEIRPGAIVAVIWTLLATLGAVLVGMVGRALLMTPDQSLEDGLGQGGQHVLPMLVDQSVPDWGIGLYIAIVLAAIMSTVDSLLVLASSAFVRDYYQKVRHPEMSDTELLGRSRWVTFGLAGDSLLIAFSVAALVPGRTVFWFAIFGWSGISATFCPTMILSLYWTKLTARGALAAMLAGFVSVPCFKFIAPQLPLVGDSFASLSELPPAFAVSMIVAIVVSLMDHRGQALLDHSHKPWDKEINHA